MIEGIYKGAASLSALERWQSAISQNIASGSVAGFKKTEMSFDGVLNGATRLDPNRTFSAVAAGVVPRSEGVISLKPGELKQTGKATDLAVQGPGFFQVKQLDGSMSYTRDGEFHVNADNVLVTKHGYEVMGEGGPILLDPEAGPLVVGADGMLSQGENQIGKLPLYDLPDPAALRRLDGGFFAPTNNQVPAIVEQPLVAQGMIETSNVSPLSEMVNLITVSRAFEASQRIITSHDETLQSAIRTLGDPAP